MRLHGVVMVADAADEKRWCAVCVAMDGTVEVRVGEPPSGWRGRRRAREREGWLRDHGFRQRIDAWSLAMPHGSTPNACAQTLATALREALGVAEDAALAEVLTHPGPPAEEIPPPGAPLADQLAATLRVLVRRGRGRAHFDGGRPADSWGDAEADGGELHVALHGPELEFEEWREALDEAGAEAGGARLAAGLERLGRSGPLFATLFD